MKNEPSIVLLGAGGHARVVAEAITLARMGKVVGALAPAGDSQHDPDALPFPILGDDSLLPELVARGVTHFVVAVGMVHRHSARAALWQKGLDASLSPLTIIHPGAIVSSAARLEAGSQIMAGAVVQTGAILEANALVNTRAVVEHDCHIGSHSHVASGAVLCGGVTVGKESLIGAGSVVRQGLRIGSGSVVGAGSVVVRDVSSSKLVCGNPAREK